LILGALEPPEVSV